MKTGDKVKIVKIVATTEAEKFYMSQFIGKEGVIHKDKFTDSRWEFDVKIGEDILHFSKSEVELV